MKPIPVKDIALSGELYARAIKNLSRLHDNYYRPGVIGRGSATLSDWPGDWEGRTILALSMHAATLNTYPGFLDDVVMDAYTRKNSKGYIGEVIDPEAINEQVYPSHSWLMRGLIEYYKLSKYKFALDWINQLLDELFLPVLAQLSDYPLTRADREQTSDGEAAGAVKGRYKQWLLSSDIGCIFIPLDGLTAAYEFTGRRDILPLIYKTIELFNSIDYVETRLQTHASLTFARGVMRLYNLTGDGALLDIAKKFFADYKLYGMTACYANFNWFMTPSWTEPCAVIDSYMLAMQLWQAAGDPEYLNDAHMILHNGLFCGQRPNGGFGCDTTGEDGMLGIREQTYEAYWCCTMRAGEGLSYAARSAVFVNERQLTIPQFFSLTAELGFATLKERALYPACGRVEFSVMAGDGGEADMRLFLPSRAKNPRATVNGAAAALTIANGFACLRAPMSEGTLIIYEFDMELHKEAVKSAVYSTPGSVVAYGVKLLSAERDAPADIDLNSFERADDGCWRNGRCVLSPISEGYLMDKEQLIKQKRRVIFNP